MRRLFGILTAVIIFSGSPVFSAEDTGIGDKRITGILIKVDEKNQSVYVKENSRIVKFKASQAVCEEFRDKINSEVDITYNINSNKSLQILTMIISEKKEASVKPKVSLKNKSKK